MITIYRIDHGFHEHYFFKAPFTGQGLRIRFYPNSPHYDTEFLSLESCGQSLKDAPLDQFPLNYYHLVTQKLQFSDWMDSLQKTIAQTTGFDWDELKKQANIDVLLYGLWHCGFEVDSPVGEFPSALSALISALDLVDPHSDEALDAALEALED
jgi:hypothetical protein